MPQGAPRRFSEESPMPQGAPRRFSEEVEHALDRYFAEEAPGDVNEYLDKLGIEHPRMHLIERTPDEGELEPQYFVPPCDPGTEPVARYEGNRLVWSCVPE